MRLLRINPWKKKLIQPMMTICGTIMTICFFMVSIMPSMAEGSARGLPGAWAFALFGSLGSGGPSLRYVPAEKEDLRYDEMDW